MPVETFYPTENTFAFTKNETTEDEKTRVELELKQQYTQSYSFYREQKHDEALEIINKLIKNYPNASIEFWNLRAAIFQVKGMLNNSLEDIRRGLLLPNADTLSNRWNEVKILGLMTTDQSKLDEAETLIKKLIVRFPDWEEGYSILITRSLTGVNLEKYIIAREYFIQFYNNCWTAIIKKDLSQVSQERLIKIRELFFVIGRMNIHFWYTENIKWILEGLTIGMTNDQLEKINLKEANKELAWNINSPVFVESFIRECIKQGHLELPLFTLIQVDCFPQDTNEIMISRLSAMRNIQIISSVYNSMKITFLNVQAFMGTLPQVLTYYYAYHNKSNSTFFKDISRFYRDICPDIAFVANWLDTKTGLPKEASDINTGNRKYKVGFISKYLNTAHSVFRDRSGVILNVYHRLKEYFDVHYYIFDMPESVGLSLYDQMGQNAHILPKTFADQRTYLQDEKLDILVFCEIGMDLFTYFLSFGRYAPCQIDTWGHSDTSGQSTIDYYFSSSLYEPENGQYNYSEKLVAMDSLCTFYHDPIDWIGPMKFWKTRQHFGFTENNNIYLCCQSIFKLHPDFDYILKDILWRDPFAILVIMDSYDIRYRLLESRCNKVFGRELSRIHFIQKSPFFEFMNYIQICDVFLDTYPFGSCNSSFEAFTLGKVVITRPSNVLNGRFTYGFYKKMGLENSGGVVNSHDEYVNRAVFYGTHPQERKEFGKQIQELAKKTLFYDLKSVEDWANEMRIRYWERTTT